MTLTGLNELIDLFWKKTIRLDVDIKSKEIIIKITLVKTMIGVTLAGLAEGMALADRAGLQQKDVLEVNQLLLCLACNSFTIIQG